MKLKNFVVGAASVVALAGAVSTAHATIVLNFAGLDGNSAEAVENYYNGGYGSLGSGPGPNYGVVFTSNAITCNPTPAGSCDTAGLPAGAQALYFVSGSAATMNVAAGFTTGFSFQYTSPFTNDTFVKVWSGLDDTGTLLATLTLPQTPASSGANCYGQPFCPYETAGVTFAGTAMSADFGGTTDEVAFSDITLGSAVAGGVPEPASWVMMLLGLGGMGAAMRMARRKHGAALAAV